MTCSAVFLVAVMTLGNLPGEAAYIEARHAELDGYHRQAFDGFRQITASGGPLANYAAVRAAVCLKSAGAHEDAERALRGYIENALPGPERRMAEAELALLLVEAGRRADAAPYFSSMIDVPVHPWWYDRYMWIAHENAAALPDGHMQGYGFFGHVVQTSIFRQRRQDAARMLTRSPHIDDRLLGVVGLMRADGMKEAQTILASWTSNSNLDEGGRARIAYLSALHALSQGTRATGLDELDVLPGAAWWRQSLALKAEELSGRRDFDAAWRVCRLLLETHPESNETADALWRYALRLRGAGRHSEAIDAYRLLAERCPQNRRADAALLAAAQILRDNGSAEAGKAFETVADRYPESRIAAEALIAAAELYDRAGKRSDMIAALERAATGPVGHYHVHRAAAMAYEVRGGAPGEAGALPLGTDIPLVRPVPVAHQYDEHLPPLITQDVRFLRLAFFGRTGFDEGEWEALDLVCRTPPEPWGRYLHRVLAHTGFAHSATQFLNEADARAAGEAAMIDRQRLFFARVHWDHVQSLARETRVDPYLILSVGRQESTFRPALVSTAGAKGLMQVMPSTARWMADVDPNISRDDAARLDDPHRSLRLGAHYLKRMLTMWDGNMVYALASYNGGPGNVQKWVRSFGHEPIDVFVEKIPFTETRDYVKRVLGNYAAYYSLYPEGDERLASVDEELGSISPSG